MSRAASAAASLPLRNSSFCRTRPEELGFAAGDATSSIWVVMASTSCNQIGEQRHPQPVCKAWRFRLLGQRAGRTGLHATQAALAVAIVHTHQFALEFSALLALAPGQAVVGTDEVAYAAMDALVAVAPVSYTHLTLP